MGTVLSVRCAECMEKVSIPAMQELGVPLRLWTSYVELVNLANSGCDLCTLFRQHLTTYLSEKTLFEMEGVIKLNGDSSRGLELQCPAPQGAYCIPVRILEDEQSLRYMPSQDKNNIFRKASTWLNDCVSNHPACQNHSTANPSDALSLLPSRLLDLSHESNIIIVNVDQLLSSGLLTAAELSEYCTLSYRWGSGSHDCVLAAPFERLLELPLTSMPQTFKDAITVARALGVRFLWIDALCIVQPSASGDDTDWRAEGPRMGIIYEKAMFTIAATCANSTDEGFLEKTGTNVYSAQACKVHVQAQE